MSSPVSRSLALVLGLFLAVNLVSMVAIPKLDVLVWLIDLRRWPVLVRAGFLAGAAGVLLAFAIRPRAGRWRRRMTIGVVVALGTVACADAVRAMQLSSRGDIRLGSAVTISWLVLVCLVVVGIGIARAASAGRTFLGTLMAGFVVGACLLGFPLLQMVTFGLTDYRRSADAILVLGARTYADGRASDALDDRMRTACDLYHQGLAPRLVLSGGPGDGPIHETQAMRRLALQAGVPESALILDSQGSNTRASIANAAAISRDRGLNRFMAVSHFYHLPRIKLEAQRAGLSCVTVPSPQGHPLNRLPFFLVREVTACWAYYLSP